jgi:hypothetical protein
VAEVGSSLEKIRDEVLSLRFAGSLPPAAAAPSEVLENLVEARTRLDRTEELLYRVLRMQSHLAAERVKAEAAAEEAWDASVVRQRQGSVRRSDEFVAPKEKYAEANLATIDLRRVVRLAAEQETQVSDLLVVVNKAHRGLDGLRQDLTTMLRAVQFENTMSRTTD